MKIEINVSITDGKTSHKFNRTCSLELEIYNPKLVEEEWRRCYQLLERDINRKIKHIINE